jgi:hypothetical protein
MSQWAAVQGLVKTGILDSMGLGYNKGGVALSFSLYGRRYCFVNAHLVWQHGAFISLVLLH